MNAKQELAWQTKCKTSQLLAASGTKMENNKDEEIVTTGGEIRPAPS